MRQRVSRGLGPSAPALERGFGMTILPELRDDLARRRPILPELRDGLVTARRRRHRRPVLVTSLAVGTLLATGGALAATGVIGIGDPVEPKYINRDPQRGVGRSRRPRRAAAAAARGRPGRRPAVGPAPGHDLARDALPADRPCRRRPARRARRRPAAASAARGGGRQRRGPVRAARRGRAVLHRRRSDELGDGRPPRPVVPRARRAATARPSPLPARRVPSRRLRAARARGRERLLRGRQPAGADRARGRLPVRARAGDARHDDGDGRRAGRATCRSPR